METTQEMHSENESTRHGGHMPVRAFIGATHAPEDELPQIVWLRGDEPFVEDFSMDAEAVMKELGIKRSRLTQISGKELRVGRIRLDRYVRPVYRPEDVTQYKAWTRATATHQRSSELLQQAAFRLEEQNHAVENRVSTVAHTLVEEVRSSQESMRGAFEREIQSLAQQLQGLPSELDRSITAVQTQVAQLLRGQAAALERMTADQTALKSEITTLRAVTEDVLGTTREVRTLPKALETLRMSENQRWEKIEQGMSNLSVDISKALSLMLQLHRDAVQRCDLAFQLANDRVQSAAEGGPHKISAKSLRRNYRLSFKRP